MDPHWTSYLGIVGSITGIAGAIMGYVSLRKSLQNKALDLRIELRRAETDGFFGLDSLRERMEEANISRIKIASAKGYINSSVMDKWKSELESDLAIANKLTIELQKKSTNYDSCSPKQLEDMIISMHSIQKRIQTLADKYIEALAKDRETVKQIREDRQRRLDLK